MKRRKLVLLSISLVLLLAMCGALFLANVSHQSASAAAMDDWPTYLNNAQSTGYNAAETTLTAANVAGLSVQWSQHSGSVSAQPVVSHGVVYWGSWDGNEYAYTISGQKLWQTQLGQTSDAGCDPPHIGVSSTASVGNIGSNPVVFVGGGGNVSADGHDQLVALNANTGAVIWRTDIGTSPAPASYQYGSPVFANGSVYIGISSLCDQPLVQGQLVKVDAATGAIQATFNAAPAGCIGAGIWSTPAVTSDGHVYVSTGNPGSCAAGEPLAFSVVELNASNLSVVGQWRANVPSGDYDFAGVTTFSAGGTNMVGAINKDGIFYALRQNDLAAGTVWQTRIAAANQGPQGGGNIAPAAFDGTNLYVASGKQGSCTRGNVVALNPATGAVIWQHCVNGPVLGAVSAFPGVVIAVCANTVNLLSSASGQSLFTYTDTHSGSLFWGGPSVAEGMIFAGNQDGYLFALGLAAPPTPTPTSTAVTATPTTPPTPTPTMTSTPTSTPVTATPTPTPPSATSYEAESSANTIAGGARVATCSGCSGGHKVGFVGHGGTLKFNNVTVSSAGTYTLTIYYVDGGANRTAGMSINGGTAVINTYHGTGNGNWNAVQTLKVTVKLNAGSNTILFSNATAWAPDFDRITV
ncbi:MAG: PQQ-binding-like beta-propeller repeat protein [Ktedonobacteraceae bacterium]|nr:PQQ-binding-like beta-propeller repeat protein [Ktedonobacteraceae bacterium]